MKFASLARLGVMGSLLLLGASGCSSSDATTGDPSTNGGKVEDSLEIYSWWTSGGEVSALNALLDVYRAKNSGVSVTNAAATDPTTAREALKKRLLAGEPPDSFQAISGVDMMSWVDQGKMKPITAVAKANGWDKAFPAAVTDTLTKNGELYAVPVNIERDNNLYYNMSVMKAHGITPPKTLDDFYAACTTLQKDKKMVPLAVPAAGWVLALTAFETLMPSVNGGDYYMSFFSGKADPTGPEIKMLFTEFAKVLQCSNVLTAAPSWTVNEDLVFTGDAAMFVMGDWAKGYFEGGADNMGVARPVWKADTDFGVVPGLGGDGYFTFNSAVFGLPLGAQHPNAANAFLTTVASLDGQQAFNPKKGSVPARTDADLTLFDDMVQASAKDFGTAASGTHKLLPGYASLTTLDFQTAINPSLLVFAVGGDRARSLDPDNVKLMEAQVPAGDIDYIIAKIAASYSLIAK